MSFQNSYFSLSKVKNIIAVASGKGGVGKSTIATNIAISLSKKGYKTGIFDADIYGPSIPIMLGTELYQPDTINFDGKNLLIPAEKFDLKIMSVGYFVGKDEALIWRGPMASNVIRQLITEVNWGELDYLVIDLPPGTGDVHLTIIQNLPLTGALIVTTPQKISLADALKAVNMLRQPQINIPIIGIVENMSYFTPEELPENKYYIFGKDGGKRFADENKLTMLGQIPIIQNICDSGDDGKPSVTNEFSSENQIFSEITDKVILQIDLINEMKDITDYNNTGLSCKCKD